MGYVEMRFQITTSRFGNPTSCLSLLILKAKIYVNVIYYVVCTKSSKMHLVVWWDCLVPKKFTSNYLLLSQLIVQWLPVTLFVIVLEVGQLSLWKVKIWIFISRVVVGGEVKKGNYILEPCHNLLIFLTFLGAIWEFGLRLWKASQRSMALMKDLQVCANFFAYYAPYVTFMFKNQKFVVWSVFGCSIASLWNICFILMS